MVPVTGWVKVVRRDLRPGFYLKDRKKRIIGFQACEPIRHVSWFYAGADTLLIRRNSGGYKSKLRNYHTQAPKHQFAWGLGSGAWRRSMI